MKLSLAKIINNKKISKDTFLLEFEFKKNVYPSQFIMIDTYPYRYLLKPFTIADVEKDKAKIIYRVISDGTKWLSSLKPLDKIKFLGPFGNVEIIKNLNITKNDKIYFVVGGSGVASSIFLYKYFLKYTNDLKIFYGEKTKDYIVNLKSFGIKEIFYSTEDGSFHFKGKVSDVFKKIFLKDKPNYIFVCGPKGMIKSIKEIVENNNIPLKAFALLEEYMCCGVGICRSCVVKVKNRETFVYKTVCKDGPIFELEKLYF